TSKLRLVGAAQHRHAQQLMRLDYENVLPVSQASAQALLKTALQALEGCKVACIEDYDKGAVPESVCKGVIAAARKRALGVLVDPPALADYSKYAGATALNLNRAEAARVTGLKLDSEPRFAQACEKLLALDLEAVVLTLDRDGAFLATRSGQ